MLLAQECCCRWFSGLDSATLRGSVREGENIHFFFLFLFFTIRNGRLYSTKSDWNQNSSDYWKRSDFVYLFINEPIYWISFLDILIKVLSFLSYLPSRDLMQTSRQLLRWWCFWDHLGETKGPKRVNLCRFVRNYFFSSVHVVFSELFINTYICLFNTSVHGVFMASDMCYLLRYLIIYLFINMCIVIYSFVHDTYAC